LIHTNLKLFPKDKNYILKEVQSHFKESLLTSTVNIVIRKYLELHNPLGIRDDTVEAIESYDGGGGRGTTGSLDDFYYGLAAIYRYQNCDNQLELIFAGHTQFEKFSKEWQETYEYWITEFCQYAHFLRAVLGLTVFNPGPEGSILLGNRLKHLLSRHFNLRVYKYRGVIELKVA